MFGRKRSARPANEVTSGETATNASAATIPPGEGPHDRSEVGDIDAYYAAAGFGYMDLEAMVVGIPAGRELNVTLSQTGQPEFHVLSQVARVVPRVYSAPRSAGQWRTWIAEMRTSLEEQDAEVSVVDGPWGRELSAEMPGATFRAIGVDGPRWMAEVQVMSTPENAEAAAEEGREVLRHLVVDRGTDPMPVREHLPVAVPDEVQQALIQAQSQAQEQMAEQARQQAYTQQMAAAQGQQAPPQQTPAPDQQVAPQEQRQQEQRQQEQRQRDPQGQPGPGPRRSGSAMDSLRDRDL